MLHKSLCSVNLSETHFLQQWVVAQRGLLSKHMIPSVLQAGLGPASDVRMQASLVWVLLGAPAADSLRVSLESEVITGGRSFQGEPQRGATVLGAATQAAGDVIHVLQHRSPRVSHVCSVVNNLESAENRRNTKRAHHLTACREQFQGFILVIRPVEGHL